MFPRQFAVETGTGRWHVRLEHRTARSVTFDDFHATGEDDAIAQAQAAHPDHEVIWAVRENNRFGVWGASAPC